MSVAPDPTSPGRGRRPVGPWASAGLVLALALGACGGPAAGRALSTSPRSTAQPPGQSSSSSTASSTTMTSPPTTTTEEPGWTIVSTEHIGVAVDERTFTGPQGGVVTVIRFRAGRVRYALHVGSQDPPAGSATISSDSGATIGPDEAPFLLAAFNGGFKMAAGTGGFEVDGQVLSPLVPGMASLVIDADGTAHVGVWGQGLPVPGEQVVSVRQNLPPLVTAGVASASVGDFAAWGSTLGGGAAVARSGLAQDAQGDLLYAAGMSLVPGDLAAALVGAGAVDAMELDINPEWVQADAASSGGLPLATLVPGQGRPADQYQVGWTRDFITVMATH